MSSQETQKRELVKILQKAADIEKNSAIGIAKGFHELEKQIAGIKPVDLTSLERGIEDLKNEETEIILEIV